MTEQLGDRHLLPVEGLDAVGAAATRSVRVVVGAEWAKSHAGQLLASCLVNLLCRQDGVVGRIAVDCEPVPCVIRLPNGKPAADFPRMLGDLVRWAVGPDFEITTDRDERPADYVIAIGSRPAEPNGGIGVIGFGWKAWIGDVTAMPVTPVPSARNPLGPFLAAALAAGEIFKAARRRTRGRSLNGNAYSLWSGETGGDLAALADGPELKGAHVPPLHIIGAGAVGNDLAYVLANAELGAGEVAVMDDDCYDRTNLNRCLLAGHTDDGAPKAEAVAVTLRAAGHDAYGFRGTLSQYLADMRTGVGHQLAAEADDLEFGVVVSCVDRGVSRQGIQKLRPRTLLGGSTLNLMARANLYSARDGAACLACFNPAEKDGDRLRALQKQLKNFTKDERRIFLSAQGVDPEAVEQWLASPVCGSVGEAAVKALAVRQQIQFSVGFVSLGAALLLAAKLLRTIVFGELGADMTSLNFFNGGMLDAGLALDPHCEAMCQEKAPLPTVRASL